MNSSFLAQKPCYQWNPWSLSRCRFGKNTFGWNSPLTLTCLQMEYSIYKVEPLPHRRYLMFLGKTRPTFHPWKLLEGFLLFVGFTSYSEATCNYQTPIKFQDIYIYIFPSEISTPPCCSVRLKEDTKISIYK